MCVWLILFAFFELFDTCLSNFWVAVQGRVDPCIGRQPVTGVTQKDRQFSLTLTPAINLPSMFLDCGRKHRENPRMHGENPKPHML